jgi:hypothetical protein
MRTNGEIASITVILSHLLPWEVSEKTFAEICALAQTATDPILRADALDFFQLATTTAARVNPRAADVSSVYRAARECARQAGRPIFETL